MAPVIAMRSRYKDVFEKTHGVKLGFMSFFVKAATYALKKFPILNASVDGNDIVYHGYFDIGIAVSSPRGLVVPILRNVDQMTLADIEKQIADYGNKAREGKLSIEELTGGTFSISNGGVFGSMLSTPIINPPQSAIMGVHATKDRPVVENGQIVIRPMNYLAVSYDHRIIDGREAVLFLVAIKDALEDPVHVVLVVVAPGIGHEDEAAVLQVGAQGGDLIVGQRERAGGGDEKEGKVGEVGVGGRGVAAGRIPAVVVVDVGREESAVLDGAVAGPVVGEDVALDAAAVLADDAARPREEVAPAAERAMPIMEAMRRGR